MSQRRRIRTADGVVHWKVRRAPFLLCSRTSERVSFVLLRRLLPPRVTCEACVTYAKQLDGE